ncbi:MAG: DivIVA domain-containing protein [Streptosporangiaceae bacterium]
MTFSRAVRRLTPDAVRGMSFRSARLSHRGFDEDDVRTFCHQVEAELALLVKERTALQEEVSRLRRRVLGKSGDDNGPGHGRKDPHLEAVSILAQAQRTAAGYVAEAQEYSARLERDARHRRDEILAAIRKHASQTLEEARIKAREAARAARSAPPPARPTPDREDLAAEVAYLRMFSNVYYAHLRGYLDALPDDLAPDDLAPRDLAPLRGSPPPGLPGSTG